MLEFRDVDAPYPGLRPFESHEGEIFFGRETHTDALVDLLEREHFLAVIGPSGLGKSSLVRAGLLPALAFGTMGTGVDWRIALLRPGNRPLRRLAQALLSRPAIGTELIGEHAPMDAEAAAKDVTADAARIEAELYRGPLGLLHVVEQTRRPTGAAFNLLVLVDQFEEIFTYADASGSQADESEAFINLMLAARADRASRIHVAITMRTDFLGNCVRFLELPEAINKAQYLTPRLTRAQLESAIVGPARVFGGEVDPAIIPELINAVANNPDQLPILQHALARMWTEAQKKNPDEPVIDRLALEAVGGTKQALNEHAQQIYASLANGDPGHSDRFSLANQLFRAITERRAGEGGGGQEVRRPQTLARIAEWTGDPWKAFIPVIKAFSAKGVHFLQHGRELNEQSVIDVSHEALIRQWERLRGWVATESERASAYARWRQLEADYRGGRSGLLVGVDLARADEWLGNAGSPKSKQWHPSARWARRYAQIPEGADPQDAHAAASEEFERVKRFIEESDEAVKRTEREESDRKEREQRLERERLEALAVAERERAIAAEREREQTAVFLAASKRQSRRLAFAAVLAALFAAVAAIFLYKSNVDRNRAEASERNTRDALRQATGLRLAIEGPAIVTQIRSGSTMQGALLGRLAHRYQPGGEAYIGLLAIADYLHQTRRIIEIQTSVMSVVFSLDGKRIVSGSFRDLHLLDPDSGKPIGEPLEGHTNIVLSVAFSADGKRIVSGSADNMLRLWEADSGKPIGEPLKGHTNSVRSVAFSPDGKRIVSGSADNMLRLWEADSGKPIGKPLKGHTKSVLSVAFSPDGKRIVSGSADNMLRLWEADSGKPIGKPLKGHTDSVLSVAFSPDGKRIVSGSADNMLRLWEADSGKPIGEPLKGHTNSVRSVAFSPDGKRIVSGSYDDTLRLWEADSGKPIGEPLKGHTDIVVSVAFSADGKRIVSGSIDDTLRLWEADSGKPIGEPLKGHTNSVLSVAFSPDGKRIVSGSDDYTLRRWPTPEAMEAIVCAKLVRNMTREEWKEWVGDLSYRRQCPDLPGPPDDG